MTDPAPGLSALAELVDPEHPEDLEELIALRNESDEVARSAANALLARVPPADRYVGNHAAVVMAPFMWPNASRFSAGAFGVLYTANTRTTAVAEAAYHAADLLRASIGTPAARIPRVAVQLDLNAADHVDVRWIVDPQSPGGRHVPHGIDPAIYEPDPANYAAAQAFGTKQFDARRAGIVYSSVRNAGGDCFATFRPAAVNAVDDAATTIALIWDGIDIMRYDVIETHELNGALNE